MLLILKILIFIENLVALPQLLHGSANPIGGQSAIVKWKWGQDAMKCFIKPT
jgi:hypothetical protein